MPNVASYKFALAKSILALAESGASSASLVELAVPFSRDMCEHLGQVDTQSTSTGSRFLDACRHYNAGAITDTELVETTALLGFNNVIDAFHIVGRSDIGTRFFVDERQQSTRGIRFTDELLALAADSDAKSPLEAEAESRWRLVESAWHERRSTGSVLRVEYDRPNEMIVRGMLGHRRSITWVRPGLSGYQASQCFYCGAPVTPLIGFEHSADVDHYFPDSGRFRRRLGAPCRVANDGPAAPRLHHCDCPRARRRSGRDGLAIPRRAPRARTATLNLPPRPPRPRD